MAGPGPPLSPTGLETLAAAEVAALLSLAPHPEGGFFRETYRSGESLSFAGFHGPRSICTAIYFLLPRTAFSALHRIRSDEVWHHYAGASLEVVSILPDGRRRDLWLGKDVAGGEELQGVVPAGAWFGARVPEDDARPWALCGCTVAPGFDFADFELADAGALAARYPEHEAVIRALGAR